jgi:peptidoglycan/LPS O-acetylase OafA/YrhL
VADITAEIGRPGRLSRHVVPMSAERSSFDGSLPRRFRADVEGLRAVAVILVVLYHARVPGLSGGFVGVDVFFVISGFLITSLLAHDVLHDDLAALPRFWARRMRRLLPAAALVVLAVLLASGWLLDPLTRRSVGHDSLAVAGFAINVVLAHRQADYFAAQLAPSPFLHFWSLAVEEQFYLVWPLVMLLVLRARRAVRWVAVGAIVALGLGSFGWSVWATTAHPTFAFYQLPTRAWELLAGAALAVSAPLLRRIPATWRGGLTYVGLVAIGIAVVRFDDSTTFPGLAALVPVLGAAAVIAAGVGGRPVRYAPDVQLVLGSAPMRWLGARSYALYLWHWPALVLASAHWGGGWRVRVVAIAIATVLSIVSYEFVEQPARRNPWLAGATWRGFALGLSLCATLVATSVVVLDQRPRLDAGSNASAVALVTVPLLPSGQRPTVDASLLADETDGTDPVDLADSAEVTDVTDVTDASDTPGTDVADDPESVSATDALQQEVDARAAALVAANQDVLDAAVQVGEVPANLQPTLGDAGTNTPAIYDDGCMLGDGETSPPPCTYGDRRARTTVVLFGDSHAAQWFPAMEAIARKHHWRLVSLTKKACPTADLRLANAGRNADCAAWRVNVLARIKTLHPALVVMTSYRYVLGGADAALSPDASWRKGLDRTMTVLRPLAKQVLVLGDTPEQSTSVPQCLAGHLGAVYHCDRARVDAVKAGREQVEREVAAAHDAVWVSTSDWLCTDRVCPVIIGNALLYRDQAHITTRAATLFQPFLDAVVSPLLTR